MGNSAIQEIFNHSSPKALSYQQHRAIRDITSCRTAALGGIKISCQNCEYEYYSYRSCRNRNCSQCQSFKQILWTEARSCEVVDTTYYHSVFTVPAELNGIFLNHQKECYNLLFKAVSSTLMTLAADKKYLGAQIGFICILHTWGSALSFHPHIHVMLMGCGLTRINKLAEKDDFLFLVKVMSRLFRGKMLAGLKKLDFSEDIDYTELYKKEWVVYMKDSASGPDNVIRYLSRYTHRIAISNERTRTSVRTLYIPNSIAKDLLELKAEQDALKERLGSAYCDFGMVIAQPDGRPTEERLIAKELADLIRKKGLPKVVFHSLRHLSTSMKLQLSGGDIKAVQGDTGHAQADMVTEVYGHTFEDSRKRMAGLMELSFFSPEQKPENTKNEQILALLAEKPELAELILALTKVV